MFRYVIALLLINTYYSSLGMPPVPVRSSVSVLLSTLEKNCTTPFLSTQINSKIKECTGVPDNEIQRIRCLIFYDINYQLCAAVNASKLVLKDDYSANLNTAQDINTVCNEAKDWVFSNISQYSHYKDVAENIFRHQVTCGQVCGTTDLTGNSNEYCKYFKWGLDMLKNQMKSSSTTTTQVASVAEIGQNIVVSAANNDQKLSTTLAKDSNDLKVKHDQSSTEVKDKEISPKSTLIKNDEAISGAQVLLGVTGVSSSTNQQLPIAAGVNKVETSSIVANEQKAPLDSGKASVNQEDLNKLQNVNQDVLNKVQKNDDETNKAQNVSQDDRAPNGQSPNVPPISEKEKDPVLEIPDTKDQGDTGLGSDGLDDIHYDTDDTDDGPDTKPEDEKKLDSAAPGSNTGNKLPVDEIDTFNSVKGGYYGSTNQDVYSDEDDHFFTFFLITVIMVVLLYVLYHNKNKVSKVFFGLMVEGRQAGRRRNSRGHAYRRLDTLEQAMSGNTSAPPSKIIY